MSIVTWLVIFISSIGSINWGLVHFFKINLVEYVVKMSNYPKLIDILYAAVAIAGFASLLWLFM